MPERNQRLRAQLEMVEKDLARLTEQVDRAPERLPIVSERRNPRLAITAYDPVSSDYPSSPADTYWIIFVDSTYDNTDDGQQAVTTTERQTLAGTTARSLTAEYIERDTLVEVIWDNGRWWISKTTGLSLALYEVTLEDTGKKDTITWDATAGAFYIWGKPVDETAEPIVIDAAADEEKLWVTAQYSDPEDRVDGLSSFAVGSRVYTAERNDRREIVAPQFHDPRWEIIENRSADTLLNGQVVRVTYAGLVGGFGAGSDRAPLLWTEIGSNTSSGGAYILPTGMPLINSPRSVANEDYGRATFASDRPVFAAVPASVPSAQYGIDMPLGPAPDSPYLWPGLPGFMSLGTVVTDDDGIRRVQVMRDHQTKNWWAKANGDWHASGSFPYIHAHPCISQSGPYDGSGIYPNIDMVIYLPRNGSQEDPNLHDGDFFRYTIESNYSTGSASGAGAFLACGDYLDGHVGEIRLLIVHSPARPGWAVANGTDNSVPNGGTGEDLVTDSPFLRLSNTNGTTGGNTTHVHTVSSGVNVLATGTDVKIDAADHTPKFYTRIPHERIH